jgi:hypothetical protein
MLYLLGIYLLLYIFMKSVREQCWNGRCLKKASGGLVESRKCERQPIARPTIGPSGSEGVELQIHHLNDAGREQQVYLSISIPLQRPVVVHWLSAPPGEVSRGVFLIG